MNYKVNKRGTDHLDPKLKLDGHFGVLSIQASDIYLHLHVLYQRKYFLSYTYVLMKNHHLDTYWKLSLLLVLLANKNTCAD